MEAVKKGLLLYAGGALKKNIAGHFNLSSI
jgi:hypothetical protein